MKIAPFVFLMAVAQISQAEEPPATTEEGNRVNALIGIKTLPLIIIAKGFPEEKAKTTAELSLRRNRVPIAENKRDGRPTLAVVVQATHPENARFWLYEVKLTMGYFVTLENGKKVLVDVTWYGPTNFASDAGLANAIKDAIEQTVDTFSNDYLKANP